ncbi:MAG: hypothetical protein LBE09_05920 [Christensenellaceae bacterium]|jgi:hypothetical protein|nr:hypothetical protein [Christensenellaceae bacterium]
MKKGFYVLCVIILILSSCVACAKDNYRLDDLKSYKNIQNVLDNIYYFEIYYIYGELDTVFIIDNNDEINNIKNMLIKQLFYRDKSQMVLGWQTKIVIVTLSHLAVPIQINSIKQNNYWYHPIDNVLMYLLEEYSIKYG